MKRKSFKRLIRDIKKPSKPPAERKKIYIEKISKSLGKGKFKKVDKI